MDGSLFVVPMLRHAHAYNDGNRDATEQAFERQWRAPAQRRHEHQGANNDLRNHFFETLYETL